MPNSFDIWKFGPTVVAFLISQRALVSAPMNLESAKELCEKGILEKTETGYAVTDAAEDALDEWFKCSSFMTVVGVVMVAFNIPVAIAIQTVYDAWPPYRERGRLAFHKTVDAG